MLISRFFLTVAAIALVSRSLQGVEHVALAEPALSPDGKQVAFVSGADIWIAPTSGGEARRLVSNPAADSRPLFSPDGTRLAFTSKRTGNGDIYVLTLSNGALRRITFDDWEDELSAWSPDGQYLYFSTNSHDISAMTDVFRISADGGTPVPVSAARYIAEYFATPAPHGGALAITTKGENWRKWWRRGHSAKDASEIWILRPEPAGPVYRRLTSGGAKDLWPMWSADARRVYFVSDRDGTENLWFTPSSGGTARQLTHFRDGRLLWPTISWDGLQIVFERNFELWLFDIASGRSAPLSITLPGTRVPTAIRQLDVSRQADELTVSPDGERLAFVARGEVFVVSRNGGSAIRLTSTASRESHPVWHPSGQKLAYVSERTGNFHLFMYDLANGVERQLTSNPRGDYAPVWSPDGRDLAFVRGGKELVVLNLERNQEQVLAQANILQPPLYPFMGRQLAWSPDARWIAFLASGTGLFRNVSMVAVAGGAVRPVTRLANIDIASLSWHPDGSALLFDTGIEREGQSLARVDLVPRLPKFSGETEQKNQPRPVNATNGAGTGLRLSISPQKPVEIRWEGIQRRLSLLPLGVQVQYTHALSPDGQWLAFTGRVAGQENVYLYSLDEGRSAPSPRLLVGSPGTKSSLQFSPDSKSVWFVERGGVQVVDLDSGAARSVSFNASVEIDFEQEKRAVFAQAWLYFANRFYDAQFNGVDWTAARERFAPWVDGARSMDEVRRIISLMIGELNSSHLAISSPDFTAARIGRIGVMLDSRGADKLGRLRVAETFGAGPAALAGLQVGESIGAVDGKKLTPNTNIEELLEGKIGQRVVISVASAYGAERDVVLRPIDVAAEKRLIYRDWVEDRRAYVERLSSGKLGYVHLYNMDGSALSQLSLDLDAEMHTRRGVVVDIRNNYGGVIDGHVLDVLTRRHYQTVEDRNGDRGQQRHIYGQRALGLPTVLVTNSQTISDGECLAEGYRQLKAGMVIGEPTAGEVVMSGPATLVDGTGLSLPGNRTLANDGTDMEGHPRPVDIFVGYALEETVNGRDGQLEAAVRHLLRVIQRQPAPRGLRSGKKF